MQTCAHHETERDRNCGTPKRRKLDGTFFCLMPLRFYRRFISPLLPPSCRFYPTCSQYACEAFERYGVFKGGWLTLKRLAKCHPYHPGGYDPLH